MESIRDTTPQRKKSIWPMFFGAFVLFALFAAGVQWLVSSGDRALWDEEALRAKQRYDILAKIQEENTSLTTSYAWADRAKGTVRIPVDRAIELTLVRLSEQGEPRPAYPVDPATSKGSALKPGGLAAPAPTPPPFATPAPEPAPVPVTEEPPAEAAPTPEVPAP
jgi:hypothetical protein